MVAGKDYINDYRTIQGGIFPLIDVLISMKENVNMKESNIGDWLYRQEDLQVYLFFHFPDS